MIKTIYNGSAYDYQSPRLGKLTVFYQSLYDCPELHSHVHIAHEIADEQSFFEMINERKKKVTYDYDERMINGLLATAVFKQYPKNPNAISLEWIDTQKKIRRNGLAKTALGFGIEQAVLADDAVLNAHFSEEESCLDQRISFYKKLGFNNVPRKASIGKTELLGMTVSAAKLKQLRSGAIKPNRKLTEYMMEHGKVF